MEIIKEAFVIEDSNGVYMCAQNTATPKLYATESSAKSAIDYYIAKDKLYSVNLGYRVKKAFIVILGDEDDSQQKMFRV